ncbi:hypothetical protein BJX64DRAFT_284704 [Aspergillus heterothallicus]
MRYILPVALLGATAVVAESAEDLINNLLPKCLRSCAVDALETASGCKISDTSCLCKTDGAIGSDVLSSLVSDLTNCTLNSDCEVSDLEGLADLDASSLEDQAQSICGGSSSSSSSSSDDDSSSSSSSSNSNSNSDSNSNSTSTSGDETADDSTPAQESDDAGDAAVTLSGSAAILAAGVMMAFAAL